MCMKLLFDLLHTGGNRGLWLQAVLCRQKPRQHLLQGALVGLQPNSTHHLFRKSSKGRMADITTIWKMKLHSMINALHIPTIWLTVMMEWRLRLCLGLCGDDQNRRRKGGVSCWFLFFSIPFIRGFGVEKTKYFVRGAFRLHGNLVVENMKTHKSGEMWHGAVWDVKMFWLFCHLDGDNPDHL